MLEEIRIRDLGVIEESVLELGPGFTAVTGETGAGKTMVTTGIGLLLGDRAESGLVRRGASHARVEGRQQRGAGARRAGGGVHRGEGLLGALDAGVCGGETGLDEAGHGGLSLMAVNRNCVWLCRTLDASIGFTPLLLYFIVLIPSIHDRDDQPHQLPHARPEPSARL